MDEPDLFRGFRSGVTGPSADAERRASAQLARAIERHDGRGIRVLRLIRKRPGRTTLAFAAVAGVIVVALFVGSPWTSSPGFLERAQASLTPPAGTVLHYRWDVTRTSEDFGCTVTTGPNETWIDQTPPYRFRALTSHFPFESPLGPLLPARTLACAEFRTVEWGGSTESLFALVFEPADTLRLASNVFLEPLASRDPLADLREMIREAIRDGRAHHEGKSELDGRGLERIRLDPRTFGCRPHCPTRPSYAYVDPETFLPVRFERREALTILPPDGRVYHVDIVERYLEVQYLPRTAANLALTDIRAQHPDATGP